MTDAFPNYFSGSLTMSAANTFTSATTTLPINRIGRVSGTKAVVLELLWVDFHVITDDLIVNGDLWEIGFSTPPAFGSMPDFAESNVIAFYSVKAHVGAGPSSVIIPAVWRLNLQTADGHGTLVASDVLNVQADSAGMGAALRFDWRVYYRFVQVPALEMMGILQSQT